MRITIFVGLVLACGAAPAAPIAIGDVMASTGVGTVLHYTNTGTLVQTLTGGSSFMTGSAFDGAGSFFVTNFAASTVREYDNDGVFQGLFGGGYATPESILFDASGDVYVGSLGNGIRKFDSSGSFLTSYISTTRVDWMDLTGDQSTMYFTQEGRSVRRVDLGTNTILSDFGSLPGSGSAFALRILGDGGVLVADGSNIKRLDSTGTHIQTYDDTGIDNWFALNLDPDGTSFWSAGITGGKIRRFDIATGTVLTSFDTGGDVWGLSLRGEITAGGAVIPEPSTIALFGLGALGLAAYTRRRLRSRA